MKALLDREACAALVHGYALHRDRLAADAYANLFTEDATLHVLGQTYAGRAAIKQRLIDTPKSPISQHLMHSVLINLESQDEATGVSYVTVYLAPVTSSRLATATGFAAIGQYVDRFRRTEQGWKIAERRFVPQLEYEPVSSDSR